LHWHIQKYRSEIQQSASAETEEPSPPKRKKKGSQARQSASGKIQRKYDVWGLSSRPTKEWKRSGALAKLACVEECTRRWSELTDDKVPEQQRNAEMETLFDYHGVTLNLNNIRSRAQKGRTRTKHGPVPPLEAAEIVLVQLILEKASLGWALSKEEVQVQMAKLVEGTDDAALYLKKLGQWTSGLQPDHLIPGDRWYSNFMARHSSVLESRRINARHELRALWTTVANYAQWYAAMGKLLLRIGFVALNPIYAGDGKMPPDDTVLPADKPLYFWNPGKAKRVLFFDEVNSLCVFLFSLTFHQHLLYCVHRAPPAPTVLYIFLYIYMYTYIYIVHIHRAHISAYIYMPCRA
jgi:hypothetical protein